MEKVLIVSEQCVSSPMNRRGTGGSLYCMVKSQKSFLVDLFYLNEEDPESEEEMRRYFRRIYHIEAGAGRTALSLISSVLRGRPRLAGSYDLQKIKKAEIPFEEYDFVVYNTVGVLGLCPLFAGKHGIAFMIDSIPMFYERRSRREHGIKKLYSLLQSHLMKKYERKYLPNLDKLAYVSKVDCEYEKSLYPTVAGKFSYVNNGVFRKDIEDAPEQSGMGLSLVFSGIMTYPPNKDAALFLAHDIFPGLRRRFAGIRLYLVGKDPDEELTGCRADDIIVTGKVPNVYSYIKGACLYVSPLRYGTGMKNKVLEAMACGKAIAASPVSVEGILELKGGENIEVVNGGASEWIERISSLLSDPTRCEEYARQCADIIQNHYSWDNAFEKLVSDGSQTETAGGS